MKRCSMTKKDRMEFAMGALEGRRRDIMAGHLEKCSECRKDVEEIRGILERADAAREDIRQALRSVDWDALPGRIADAVLKEDRKKQAAGRDRRGFRLFRPQFRPVLAGVLLGLTIGSLAMYLVLRRPSPGPDPGRGFFASRDFLEKVELEMARRETLDYLRKSQYILLDFMEPPAGRTGDYAAFGTGQARDLLSKKKYLNPQLEKYQMAKAKAICDQIELLFLELAQISEEISQAELGKIRALIEERQLLLKINLVKKELEEREV